MIRIRKETEGDSQGIHRIHLVAFGQQEEADLVDRSRQSKEFLPGLSLVAEEEGILLGHILFTRSWVVDSAEKEIPVLTLAPVGVLPEHQGKGVGRRLIREGIDRARKQGERIIHVLGHPAYYSMLGFTRASTYGIHCPFPAPDEAFMIMALTPGALDGVSGIIRYASPFYE